MAGRIGSNLQSAPAVTCMKILLTVFNFIFWVSGVAILALGIWMKMELYMYMQLTESYRPETPYVLMGVGGGIIIIGSLGCCCTAKKNACLLYVYAIVLMLVFVAELAVSVSAFIYKGKMQDEFGAGLESSMKIYGTNEDAKKTLDNLQIKMHCCGNKAYSDWYPIPWDGKAEKKVPESCCITRDCDTSSTTEIYTDGCNAKLENFMEANFMIIGGVAIGFSFLQLFGALMACCLAKNINKAKYEQVA